ncbi:MAG: ATP-binding cassette domain-containing protein [Bacteroidetes bacterium]|nr:MAG: ATP-binding cassette domain-containing protein [Bacteroidota bacterium]
MTDLLEVVNVSKRYATHQALQDVSLRVPKGVVFGLVGPNGAGKSTLIRIITQIILRDSGEVFFNGQAMTPDHVHQIGYMPEERGLYKKMKVGEQLLYLARLKGMTKADAMERLKYWFEKFEIKPWWNKTIQDLSKGMQQKIQFLSTVLHKPALLILDEPFSGFDPVNANLIKDEILELKRQGTTIIFSTHRMESVEEMCDHLALINLSKKILDGETKQIKKQYQTNTFVVEYNAHQPIETGESFSVLQYKNTGRESYTSLLKAKNGTTPNMMLQELLPQGAIYRFEEKLPTINDIFISLVTGRPITDQFELTSQPQLVHYGNE